MKDRTLKIYKIEYTSGMFSNKSQQTQYVYSDKTLDVGDFIVVEHIGFGIFLGRVIIEEVCENNNNNTDEDILEYIKYRYVQHIDLYDYMDKINKEKRKQELKLKMRERFAIIDEEKKYQYYADLDEDLKKMYDEYKEL